MLARQAERVAAVMAEVDGVVDPRVGRSAAMQPAIEIEVDLERRRRSASRPGDVRRAEATLLQGIQVGSVFEEQKVFDVIVQGARPRRRRRGRPATAHRPAGRRPRHASARWPTCASPIPVGHRPGSRLALRRHRGRVEGRSVEAVAADIEQPAREASFPMEYHAEVLTGAPVRRSGRLGCSASRSAAAIAVLLLLQAAFRSWRLAALVFAALPLVPGRWPAGRAGRRARPVARGDARAAGVFGLATRTGVLLVAGLAVAASARRRADGPPGSCDRRRRASGLAPVADLRVGAGAARAARSPSSAPGRAWRSCSRWLWSSLGGAGHLDAHDAVRPARSLPAWSTGARRRLRGRPTSPVTARSADSRPRPRHQRPAPARVAS